MGAVVDRDGLTPYASVFPGGVNSFSLNTNEKAMKFREAVHATSPREARELLTGFLKTHYARGGLEDGSDFYMMEIARFELMRACYHLGDLRAGDRLLATIDPLHILGDNAVRAPRWSIYGPPEVLAPKTYASRSREETAP
ncbi:MAG: hypothetical protein ACYTKD_11095 [Planctomycetota bacterium]